MSSLLIPYPRTTLHLYRHLLREATYLPPAVRPFFWDRISTRFRLHQNDPEPDVRIQKAHKDLRYLRSANGGHLLRMRRILMMGFGRTGRRRRELISELVHKTDGRRTDSTPQETARDSIEEEILWDDWLAHWDKDKVLAFAQAQASVDLPEMPLPTGKFADPLKAIPTENIWGKPLAKKLARSKLRKEYKAIIKRLLPPVEADEWELLRSLATGEAGPRYAVPKRRMVAAAGGGATDEATHKDDWEWKDYVLKPVRAVDAKKSRKLKSLTGETDDTSPFPQPALGLHHITERSWRRLYSDIWRLTATMTQREDPKKWDTKWGKLGVKIAEPSPSQAEFFDGIPSTGRF
ncbi:hypothetical protein GE09DRAFT_627600 [Coniochaeta sp. 2T2.1]|nr:hypothetical protein GE09DRAFT_627600 [Coniochaeta sp. 2T2.1]